MICDKVDEVIQERFELRLCKYQTCLEKSMKCSNFIFDFPNFCITNVIK